MQAYIAWSARMDFPAILRKKYYLNNTPTINLDVLITENFRKYRQAYRRKCKII